MLCSRNKGFTLIELLVVLSIISLLSSIVLTSLTSVRAKARNAKRNADIEQLRNAFNLSLNGSNSLPDSGTGNWSCISSSCYEGWSIYPTNATIDAFLAPSMSQKPSDPTGGKRGYGGYIYLFNWGGGSVGYGVFTAGSYIFWILELPYNSTSCGPGITYNVTVDNVQCMLQL